MFLAFIKSQFFKVITLFVKDRKSQRPFRVVTGVKGEGEAETRLRRAKSGFWKAMEYRQRVLSLQVLGNCRNPFNGNLLH